MTHGDGSARGTAEYRGEFREGLKHGKGVKTSAWGDRYEGGFVNDRKSGKGCTPGVRVHRGPGSVSWVTTPPISATAWERITGRAAIASKASGRQTGIAYKVLRVGKIETVEGYALQVRLLRLEGVPQAVSGSNLQPGILDTAPDDWNPCS